MSPHSNSKQIFSFSNTFVFQIGKNNVLVREYVNQQRDFHRKKNCFITASDVSHITDSISKTESQPKCTLYLQNQYIDSGLNGFYHI